MHPQLITQSYQNPTPYNSGASPVQMHYMNTSYMGKQEYQISPLVKETFVPLLGPVPVILLIQVQMDLGSWIKARKPTEKRTVDMFK